VIKTSLKELRSQRKLLVTFVFAFIITGVFIGHTDHSVESFRIFTSTLEWICAAYMVGNVGSHFANKGGKGDPVGPDPEVR
jgi:Ca2+/H+ antiporter